MHDSYRSSLPLQNVGLEEDRPVLEDGEASRNLYVLLTIDGNKYDMFLLELHLFIILAFERMFIL